MIHRERVRPAREIGIGKLFAFFPDQCNLLVKFVQPGGESHPITRNYAEGHGSAAAFRSEEHTSELQSLMRISYAVFCLKKKKKNNTLTHFKYIIFKESTTKTT